MDDLQFRRSILADPNHRDDAINAKIKQDPVNKKFTQDVTALDDDIAQALNINVPSELVNKLMLRQTFASHQQQKSKTRMHLAMAASVAIVMGLMINIMLFSSTYKNLGDYAIAHVNHEAEYFSNQSEAAISLASLNEKMAVFNGRFAKAFGKLLFADYCRFDGNKSLHLVFQGKTSPVNVFVLPNNEDIKFVAQFSDDKLQGRSLHFKQSNVIVVGDKQEPINLWQERLNQNISWSI
ncbi:Protein of unknown function [Colwellia chukchiensis]|uniref:DUF3379 domain-containing protein n=1 Tax=Colwellia chukchiensis TaxID=641665 RepID=A0A1H7HC71_9GAMM|nr:DUF3379 family protein [Colwellia chukchiensis]SEK45735.1 Protein of unknown function [Colwellia chukchiensis]